MTAGIALLHVEAVGAGGSVQDAGRPGWRRFGVPPGGFMDPRAAAQSNRLLDNPPGTPALELFRGGHRFRVLRDTWVALAGAEGQGGLAAQRTSFLRRGEEIRIAAPRVGVWSYLAVPGGWCAPAWLGGVGALASADMGVVLTAGRVLEAADTPWAPPHRVAARHTPWTERAPVPTAHPLPVWPGPQASWFSPGDRLRFFSQEWRVGRQCDRAGYRLEGEPLAAPRRSLVSEPQPVGSIQMARDGRPIVILGDGPAIGGYPKIGILDPHALPDLVQLAPGQGLRFHSIGDSP